jgi:hypothetical protein
MKSQRRPSNLSKRFKTRFPEIMDQICRDAFIMRLQETATTFFYSAAAKCRKTKGKSQRHSATSAPQRFKSHCDRVLLPEGYTLPTSMGTRWRKRRHGCQREAPENVDRIEQSRASQVKRRWIRSKSPSPAVYRPGRRVGMRATKKAPLRQRGGVGEGSGRRNHTTITGLRFPALKDVGND